MMNVLIVSDDEARSTEVERLTRREIPNSRVTVLRRDQLRDAAHADSVQAADVVIAIERSVNPELLGELEHLLDSPRGATGLLLVDGQLSTDDVLAAMRAGVRYATSWPFGEQVLPAELHAVEKRMKRSSSVREGRVLTFLSSQGGSGTTFVATQVAHACATQHEKRVLLIDADRQFSDALLFLSAELPNTTLADLAAQVDRLDAALFDAGVVQLHANLDVLPGAGDPVKAAQIQAGQLAQIVQFAVPRYDLVIVDAGHHIDAAILTLLDHSTSIFTVMRQTVPDLYSARRLTTILQEVGYSTDKIETIVNRFDGGAKLGADVVKETLQSKAIHTFPDGGKEPQNACDEGVPLAQAAPRGKLSRTIGDFVTRHFGSASEANTRGWSSLFRGSRVRDNRSNAQPVRYS